MNYANLPLSVRTTSEEVYFKLHNQRANVAGIDLAQIMAIIALIKKIIEWFQSWNKKPSAKLGFIQKMTLRWVVGRSGVEGSNVLNTILGELNDNKVLDFSKLTLE